MKKYYFFAYQFEMYVLNRFGYKEQIKGSGRLTIQCNQFPKFSDVEKLAEVEVIKKYPTSFEINTVVINYKEMTKKEYLLSS